MTLMMDEWIVPQAKETAVREITVVSTLRGPRAKDNADHKAKRIFPFPENPSEIEKWSKEAQRILKEKYKSDVDVNVLDLLERGFSLANQAEMGRKLNEKYGKPAAEGGTRTRDTSGAEEL
jgi:hypothetical protein